MSTLADVIKLSRLFFNDQKESRFEDDEMLLLLFEAIKRVNHLFYQHGINLGVQQYTFDSTSGQQDYSLPGDFMAVGEGLYRTDVKMPLKRVGNDEWERLLTSSESSVYRVFNNLIQIQSTPIQETTFNFYYYSLVDTTGWDLTYDMPWDGKFDSPIAKYLYLLAGETDEMDVTFDAQMLKEIENLHLNTYSSGNPNSNILSGWV